MDLTKVDDLRTLRRKLHQKAELSGREENTAAFVSEQLEQLSPDKLWRDVGGHGVAALFKGEAQGPRLLFRADLDALPIPETVALEHASASEDVAHKCGHDGHMTVVLGLAARLAKQRPERGEVVVLFQPAEETGEGAARVVQDPKYREFRPDRAFGIHNLPGFPLGSVILREGVYASASVGFVAELHGATAHAAEPESARSPALAMAALVQTLSSLPQNHTRLHEAAKVTVIHARLGSVAFGTTPGEAVVMATLRAHEQEVIEELQRMAEQRAAGISAAYELELTTRTVEPFPSTVSASEAVEVVRRAAERAGRPVVEPRHPFAWSEDFGHFLMDRPGAFIGLGAGEEHPPLHHPTYDYPDELTPHGVRVLEEIVRQELSS